MDKCEFESRINDSYGEFWVYVARLKHKAKRRYYRITIALMVMSFVLVLCLAGCY